VLRSNTFSVVPENANKEGKAINVSESLGKLLLSDLVDDSESAGVSHSKSNLDHSDLSELSYIQELLPKAAKRLKE
jgi:hypothetical protein